MVSSLTRPSLTSADSRLFWAVPSLQLPLTTGYATGAAEKKPALGAVSRKSLLGCTVHVGAPAW